MQTTFKFFFLCLFCFSLTLVSGCGGDGSSLTSSERTKADKIPADHGKNAIAAYLSSEAGNEDDLVLVRKILKYFVSKGADVNVDNGRLLIEAAQFSDLEFVKFFVSLGADVNIPNVPLPSDYRYSPLLAAIRGGDLEIVKFLVSQGANVNEIGSPSHPLPSPLSMAAIGNLEMVKFLVSQGADVNIGSPLSTAVEFGNLEGNLEIVKFLVSNGANVNAKGRFGMTPLDNIPESADGEPIPAIEAIVEYLRSVGAKSGREL